MIELLEIERECMTTAAHDGCDRDCANCILVQNEKELFEMYTKVIDLLYDIKEGGKHGSRRLRAD